LDKSSGKAHPLKKERKPKDLIVELVKIKTLE
jgi:hypothetical protein